MIICLSDGRRIEIVVPPWGGDYDSARINIIGKKGSIRESFILDRLSIEKILSLMVYPAKKI